MVARIIVVLLLSLVHSSLGLAQAQQPNKVASVGFLSLGFPPLSTPHQRMHEAFYQGLREVGYTDGKNLIIEFRSANGNYKRFPRLAAELVSSKVDLIVAPTTPALRAAKQATTKIPIVMLSADDPVTEGIVDSLARPGGNITGLSLQTSEGFAGKYLELLREAVPKVSRVAILGRPSARSPVQAMEQAARSLDVRVQLIEVDQPGQLEGAFAAMTAQNVGALVVTPSPFNVTHRDRIVSLAAKHRLPAMYGLTAFVDAGGLMAYGASLRDLFRRAATYVDKILKGAKPADLPVEQATKFDLVINLKTARALGLIIPPSLLGRADRVID